VALRPSRYCSRRAQLVVTSSRPRRDLVNELLGRLPKSRERDQTADQTVS
jgi:hypothetical protein